MTIKNTLDACRDEIITAYQGGESTVALGKRYGCSNASVYIFLRDAGVEMRQIANKYDDLIPSAMEMLAKGDSIQVVAQATGIPRSTLQRIAKKHGHDTSKHIKRCEVRLEDHAYDIIRDYAKGESQSDIASRYGCDQSNISRLLDRYGVETRFNYECDHSFFDRIDSEAKAYTLGFFVADGYNDKGNVMSIRIIDEDVLLKMKAEMKYTGPVRVVVPPKGHPHWQVKYALDIASKQMCQSLTKLGCPTAKTFLTRFPTTEEVPDDLLVHYIRGVFDGDGSLYHTTNGWHISIAGTSALLDPMRHYICQKTDVMFGLYPDRNIYTMKVGGNRQVRKIADWIYENSSIHMDRKHSLYLSMIQ